MGDVGEYIASMATAARKASVTLRVLSAEAKNRALGSIGTALDARRDRLAAANARDLERGKAAGLSAAMLDRLEASRAANVA